MKYLAIATGWLWLIYGLIALIENKPAEYLPAICAAILAFGISSIKTGK